MMTVVDDETYFLAMAADFCLQQQNNRIQRGNGTHAQTSSTQNVSKCGQFQAFSQGMKLK